MEVIKKVFILMLTVLMLNLYFPKVFYAADGQMYAENNITMHPLQIRSTPDEDIATEEPKKKSKWWLWTLLSVVVVGGGAAVASAGGSDSSGDSGGGTSTEGSAEISW
jgi:hypothetical protein